MFLWLAAEFDYTANFVQHVEGYLDLWQTYSIRLLHPGESGYYVSHLHQEVAFLELALSRARIYLHNDPFYYQKLLVHLVKVLLQESQEDPYFLELSFANPSFIRNYGLMRCLQMVSSHLSPEGGMRTGLQQDWERMEAYIKLFQQRRFIPFYYFPIMFVYKYKTPFFLYSFGTPFAEKVHSIIEAKKRRQKNMMTFIGVQRRLYPEMSDMLRIIFDFY